MNSPEKCMDVVYDGALECSDSWEKVHCLQEYNWSPGRGTPPPSQEPPVGTITHFIIPNILVFVIFLSDMVKHTEEMTS